MFDSVDVAMRLILRVTDQNNKRAPVSATLRYDCNDPYAVTIAFDVAPQQTVKWLFARQLLTEGFSGPVGEGDVKLWPAGDPFGTVVCLSLSSSTGSALFELPADSVMEFLAASWASVPPGEETQFLRLDSELSELMANGNWRGI